MKLSDARKIREFNRALRRERGDDPGPKVPIFLGFIVLFTCAVIFRYGLTYSVEYRLVPVLSVTQIAGESLSSRIVRIDLGDQTRLVRTSDPLVFIRSGEKACIAQRRVIGRYWIRYSLALPSYCRSQIRPSSPQIFEGQ